MGPRPIAFRPLAPVDGYLPIEDHGLVGDGSTAALIARDGAVAWLCVPRFDAPPLFCSILDRHRGGSFRIAPTDLVESRQQYEPDTGILVTELRGRDGTVEIIDAMTLRAGVDLHEDAPAGRSELLRSVRVVEGAVRLEIDLTPRGGARAIVRGHGIDIRCTERPDLPVLLAGTHPLDGLHSTLELRAGEHARFALRWGDAATRRQRGAPDEAALDATRRAWQRWIECFTYDGPRPAAVRRSAITLKLLDHFANGAIVAAPTSSLPEAIGGPRNWDYRYAWVRDASYSVYAMRRVGLTSEAWGFLAWVLDALERSGDPHVLYDIDGGLPPPEREDEELEGYRCSPPVRWGNAADTQVQHDIYGEVVDCAYQWAAGGGRIDDPLWARLQPLVETAATVWRHPDQGIWEVRSPGRVFTYSAALCNVALDRGARLAERFGLPGDVASWRREAERIRTAIVDDAWDDERASFVEHVGAPGALDASLLALPLRRVVDARHPRMVATTEAVVRELGAGDGLLYRYLPDRSPDGVAGHEGAFLLCSFWLVDNLAAQGRLDEAGALFESLCDRGGTLGLLPEQIDPPTGAFLGNHPQAFSHVGMISSGVNLTRRVDEVNRP